MMSQGCVGVQKTEASEEKASQACAYRETGWGAALGMGLSEVPVPVDSVSKALRMVTPLRGGDRVFVERGGDDTQLIHFT